jgi:hypothetical protein
LGELANRLETSRAGSDPFRSRAAAGGPLILFGLSGFCFFATTLQQFKHHVRDILLQRKPNRVAHLFYATDKHDLLAQWQLCKNP